MGKIDRSVRILHYIACFALFLIAVLTLLDITMRASGSPIVGSLELVTLFAAVVVGFSNPYTSLLRGHVYVDVLIERLPSSLRNTIYLITRCLGIGLFIFLTYNFISYGIENIYTGEVSPSFRIPLYPIAFALAFSFFMQSVVLIFQIYWTFKKERVET